MGVGVGVGIGVGVGVGTGVGVGVGTEVGVGAGIGVDGMVAAVAATPASIIALTSGGVVGVAVGRPSTTAVSTAMPVSWVGGGASIGEEHPTSATSSAIAATDKIFIRPPYPHPPPHPASVNS